MLFKCGKYTDIRLFGLQQTFDVSRLKSPGLKTVPVRFRLAAPNTFAVLLGGGGVFRFRRESKGRIRKQSGGLFPARGRRRARFPLAAPNTPAVLPDGGCVFFVPAAPLYKRARIG